MRLAAVPIPGTRPEGMLFPADQLRKLLDVARMVEANGIDDLAMSEHVIMANKPETYPFGRYPHTIGEPFPEPMATLAAMAAVTERVRQISTVVIAPLRPAALLAKQAATLHALSEGRFVMGVSTSWQQEEYAALGVPFEERGARLNDIVGACRALWSSAPASFSSPSVSFQDMYCIPRPAHAADIPIWFGSAFSPRLVKRVAEFGHGWMPFIGSEPKPLEMMTTGVQALRDALQQAGRDAEGLEVSALLLPRGRSLQKALEQDVPAFQAAGVNHLRVQMSMFAATIDEIEPFLRELRVRVDAVSQ
jgi:probable F420-dependent oxidoreductase